MTLIEFNQIKLILSKNNLVYDIFVFKNRGQLLKSQKKSEETDIYRGQSSKNQADGQPRYKAQRHSQKESKRVRTLLEFFDMFLSRQR